MPAVPTTMRAVEYDRYGPPDVLHVATVPTPQPGRGEVLVRVEATSVNGGELAGRSGRLRLVLGRSFPKRAGIDLVGTVAAVGPDAGAVQLGQRVWAICENPIGTTAEYFAVPHDHLSAAPANLDAVEAVTLLAGGTTAITALRDKAHLRAGERLLVRGAAGGVGSMVVQVGALMGAHVTAIARESSQDFVRQLGAEHVVDRSTGLSSLGRFDVIVDSVGSDLGALRRHLGPGGRMVALTIDMSRPLPSLAGIAASVVHGSQRMRFFLGRARTPLLEELADMAERQDVRPVVDRVFPLDEAARAHAALEHGGIRGKCVIRVQDAEVPDGGA